MKPNPKQHTKKSKRDPKYLEWLKTQPCANPNCPGNCGDIVPAHMSILGGGGMGTKAPDSHALPLGCLCHGLEHGGAITFWGQGTKAETKIFVQGICDEHLRRYENENNSRIF